MTRAAITDRTNRTQARADCTSLRPIGTRERSAAIAIVPRRRKNKRSRYQSMMSETRTRLFHLRRRATLPLPHRVVQASQGCQVGVRGREEALLRPGERGLAVHDVGGGGIAITVAA